MSLTKKVLTVRILGKARKQRVRKLLCDLAHFRNLLIIFLEKYRQVYQETLLHESLLYALVSAKGYKGKHKKKVEEVFENVNRNEGLRSWIKLLKEQKERIGNPHFIQATIRQVLKDYKSFFASLKAFKRDHSKFLSQPRPPKPKKLRYLMNFSAEGNLNTFRRERDSILIRLKGKQRLKVKLPEEFPHRVSSVRLKFFGNDLFADVVYEVEAKNKQPKGDFVAGIDIGLDELLSVVSDNPEVKSFIISGKEIKAFNQWFNKERAKLQSEVDKAKNEKKDTRELEVKLKVLSSHRKRWIEDNFHKISRKLVDLLYQTGHKVIYIGKNALESKNGIKLGRKTNQEFGSIPFRKLVGMIKYKARELGMEVVEVDESWTSKTSPFADIIKVQETKNKTLCSGRRERNLFKDGISNKVFHADLVGALNIIRSGAKLLKLRFYDNLKVVFLKLCNPLKLKLVDLIYKVFPKSLWIGDSKQDLYPAGWTEILLQMNTFEN